MGETLTQQRRVSDEGLMVVKLCRPERNLHIGNDMQLTVPGKEGPANSVPAAAVIRRVQALIGITGRKARVGGIVSWG